MRVRLSYLTPESGPKREFWPHSPKQSTKALALIRIPEIYSADDYLAIYGAAWSSEAPSTVSARVIDEVLKLYSKGHPDRSTLAHDWAQMLHNPQLAKQMLDLDDYVTREMPWAQQQELRELAIQAVNKRFRCEYEHVVHHDAGVRAGLSAAQLVSLDFPDSQIFTDEQRLVLRFTNAMLDGEISDELFADARDLYGDRGVLELVFAICWAISWAMIANLLQPEMEAVQ